MKSFIIFFAILSTLIACCHAAIDEQAAADVLVQRTLFYIRLIELLQQDKHDQVRQICAESAENRELCSNEAFNFLQASSEMQQIEVEAGVKNLLQTLKSKIRVPRWSKLGKVLSQNRLTSNDRDEFAEDFQSSVDKFFQSVNAMKRGVVLEKRDLSGTDFSDGNQAEANPNDVENPVDDTNQEPAPVGTTGESCPASPIERSKSAAKVILLAMTALLTYTIGTVVFLASFFITLITLFAADVVATAAAGVTVWALNIGTLGCFHKTFMKLLEGVKGLFLLGIVGAAETAKTVSKPGQFILGISVLSYRGMKNNARIVLGLPPKAPEPNAQAAAVSGPENEPATDD